MRRGRFFWPALTLVSALLVLVGAAAGYADVISVDGDTAVASGNLNYGTDLSCAALGTAVTGLVGISYNGSDHYSAGETLTVTLTPDDPGITATADAAQIPAGWGTTATSYSFNIHTTVSTSVTGTGHKVTVTVHGNISGFEAGSGAGSGKPQFVVNVDSSCGTSVPSNSPPSAGTISGDASVNEGSSHPYSDTTASDPDAGDTLGYTWSVASGNATIASGQGTTTVSLDFTDGPSTVVLHLVVDDGLGGHSVSPTDFSITENNVIPSVAKPAFGSTTINCQTNASLTAISFSDPGLVDNPWAVDVDWGDGTTHTTFNAATQGSQSNQSHLYTTPGTYTATVKVTDKDGGPGSNTSSNTIEVLQTYTVRFLQPLDGLTPSQLITNTMKNGRTVPVKATIYDDCAQAYVTGSSGKAITIKVKNANFTSSPGATDPVESYSDAGASSGNATSFRWTSDGTVAGGGFWIYNLDSSGTGFGLTTNTTYEVHVVVNGTCQSNTYALLKPVK